ncbi:MAG: hypothetical protein Q9223_001086 [Gallowayella weberi]
MPIATKDLIDGGFNDSYYPNTQDGPNEVQLKVLDEKQNAPGNLPVPPCCIFNYIKHQVNTKPDAPALQYELNPAVSYAELDKLTEKITRVLSIRKGTIVPICMDVSINLVATIVATLRAGAAYLVLDPHGSVERNNCIIEDCTADIVVVNAQYAPSYEKGLVLDSALSHGLSY